MEAQFDLISFLGGGGVVAAALVWGPKKWIEIFFEKQIIKAKAEIERFGVEHQIMFSHLHKQRAESLERCYLLLQNVLRKGADYTSVLETQEMGDKQARRSAAVEALRTADEYVCSKVIYLPESLADRVNALLKRASREIVGFRFSVDTEDPRYVDHQAWARIWENFTNELPETLKEIEREFRCLLESKSSH